MSASRIASAIVLAVAGAALAGCGGQGLEQFRGTKGLAPAPENLAYPSVGVTPPPRPGRLRSPEEQKRLEADLLARRVR
ncbi:hypothetical protein ACFQ4O_14225 [Methylopila musalis]|uniref:DUF3035 domain-containing protein n=1 Tax=Methylopila musalis TaxID=1134781 RepID=A0ABW3ZAW3_9HYPH